MGASVVLALLSGCGPAPIEEHRTGRYRLEGERVLLEADGESLAFDPRRGSLVDGAGIVLSPFDGKL